MIQVGATCGIGHHDIHLARFGLSQGQVVRIVVSDGDVVESVASGRRPHVRDARRGDYAGGSGVEWNKTIFQSPPSRRSTQVVGAEMCARSPSSV